MYGKGYTGQRRGICTVSPFYAFVRVLAGLVIYLLFWPRVSGRENLPKRGPVLLVANHKSWWDPVLLGVVLPRQVYFMAKAELYKNPLFGAVLRGLGAFPVHRGTADRASLRQTFELLSRGMVVGLFPEGTRSRTDVLKAPEPGAGYIALRTPAQVIPAGIVGRYRLFRRMAVHVGPAVAMDDLRDGRIDMRSAAVASDRMMATIAGLCGREWHGSVYE